MIVTRFAPSPTGYLHIGGLRTALYNYLYARANNGKFLLRIEDTDLKRNSEEATQAIKEAFAWCKLDHDGEVTYQSKRFDLYKEYVKKLLDEGKAYKCYMSKEELEELRASQEARKEHPKYDNRYRDFKGTPPAGIEPVIRIQAPLSGEIVIHDGIKGAVKFKVEDIDYKNVDLLKNFMNDKGKISPSRVTGLEAKIQRKIAKAIKRARQIALLPYTRIEK